MHRHADADLTALLTATVPPADLNKVSVFAAHLDKFHQEVPNQWPIEKIIWAIYPVRF